VRQRQQLTPAGNAFLRDRLLGESRVVRWQNEGRDLEGVLTVPPPDAAKPPYKLLLYPHGGPHSRSAQSFDFTVQVFAAHGYAVFQPNYRGSSGYGQEFIDADRGDFGGGDMRDVLAGIDRLVKDKLIDPGRQFVYGSSYGGFLTSWLVGHTAQFRAAVAQNAVTDLNAMWGLSDLQSWTQWEFGGRPWEVPAAMRRHSPLTYAAAVRTPTLILHARDDRRCPLPMGRMFYQALAAGGVPTQLVVYPGEGHGIRQPRHREDVLRRALAWFQQFDDLRSQTESLKGADAGKRKAAAEALGKLGPAAREAVPALRQALADSDGAVRVAAALALWRVGGQAEAVVPTLLAALNDPRKEVRQAVLEALWYVGPHAAAVAPALRDLLASPDRRLRIYAAYALWKVDPATDRALPVLARELKDRDEETREDLVGLLSLMGPAAREVTPAVLDLLKDKDVDLRGKAVNLLVAVEPSGEAVPALREALRDPEAMVRGNAAIALSKMGTTARRALPDVRERLQDDNGMVRAQVAIALWRLDGDVKAVLPVLLAELDNRKDFLAPVVAMQGLGFLGREAREAVPALRAMLRSSYGANIQDQIREALEAIEGPAEAGRR
jgi:HEAT repeat protein/poly(3-hydroxybutyrate) depolymerase